MRKVLQAKFSDPELKEKLLATHDAYIVENCPFGHDTFWADNGDGSGQNKLGIMLMELRASFGEIRVVPMSDELKTFYATRCNLCEHPCHFTNSHLVYNRCDKHLKEELRLGNVSTYIEPSTVSDGSGRFLYFNLNEMPEFVEEAARLIAEHINTLHLKKTIFYYPRDQHNLTRACAPYTRWYQWGNCS
jgi:hypothetical protein